MKNASNAAQIVKVAFKRRPYEQVKDAKGHPIKGLYIEPVSGRYYERPFIDGRQTFRRLQSTTAPAAQKEMFRLREQLAKFKAREPGARNPYRHSEVMSVAELCDFYVECGCPKRRSVSSPRTTQTLREEKTRIENLKGWWARVPFENIEPGDCTQYHQWRIAEMKKRRRETLDRRYSLKLEKYQARIAKITARSKGARKLKKPNPPAPPDYSGIKVGKGGDRQVEKELVTLSQVFWWATINSKKTGIKNNPLAANRPRLRDPAAVVHCRDHMPENAEELHGIARMLFETDRSEVLGWQVLIQAMTGPRGAHVLKLRWDAQNKNEAGYIQNNLLYLYNSTTSKGTYPFIKIHSALEQCLAALKKWRADRFPDSPWFFPSPADPNQPVGSTALTHALDRITPAMGLPKRTSHGLRAYYVNVLRSKGTPDAEVALRIGQRSGGRLIVDVYGVVPENELSWLPAKADPAWKKFEPPTTYTQTELLL